LGDKNLGGSLVVLKLNGAPITKQPVTKGTFTSGLNQVVTTKGMKQISPFEFVDAVNHKVVFKVTSALTNDNNGFNFNGYAKGKATFVVPVGWHADFIFTNNQALPHSLAVLNTLTYGPEVRPLAATPDPTRGITGNAPQYAGFTALAAGKFYLVCLVPGHIQAGMWDKFTVSSTATQPSITVSK
jgi:sulfocyanin